MNVSAKIIADSVDAKSGNRVTTFELEYPRYIHSQLMTHRVFSRNCASSRAIPINKVIEQIECDSQEPMWTYNKSGMQGKEVQEEELKNKCLSVWNKARDNAINTAKELVGLGIHKQDANRLLEPFQTMKTILTGTEFSNFFKLRIHKDAQPEIRALAECMRCAINQSMPTIAYEGYWHLPYISEEDLAKFGLEKAKKISTSCCAQVSYRALDQSEKKALAIFDKLVSGDIIHGSAFEHICTPSSTGSTNLKGWRTYRTDIEGKQDTPLESPYKLNICNWERTRIYLYR